MTPPPNPAPRLRIISAIGNLLGAIVAFLYFRVIDIEAANAPPVGVR